MDKVLITITTCKRLSIVKKYILPYIEFVNEHENFAFLLALDGNDSDYLSFCDAFRIPLLYSDEREGVGISKNRVLSQFPAFDHYFFIDDDVELLDGRIFDAHVQLGKRAEEFHHLSSTRLFKRIEQFKIDQYTINYGLIGGGYFNYFNATSLKKIGGWHIKFAEFRRYGHTEHTYRFVNAGFTKYPFTIINDCITDVIIHDPVHVTPPNHYEDNGEDELFPLERELINEKLVHFPVQTIAPYHFNGQCMEQNELVKKYLLEHPKRYPLLSGKERLRSLSTYHFFVGQRTQSLHLKVFHHIKSFVLYPTNSVIKHSIKRFIRREKFNQ